MTTRKNRKNRTAFVYDRRGNFEAFVSKSFRGAKQGSQLTLRYGNERVDLTGAEINVLRRVLTTASRVASQV